MDLSIHKFMQGKWFNILMILCMVLYILPFQSTSTVMANPDDDTKPSDSWGVALGDLDGDGDLDAFVANQAGYYGDHRSGPEGFNEVWLNDGYANFTYSGQQLGQEATEAVDLADLDGDGDLDAFTANTTGPIIWVNDGNANFTEGPLLGNANAWAVDLGDLDSDGDQDAFVGVMGGQDQVWINQGSLSFTLGQEIGSWNQARHVALSDLDGDLDLDAFVVNHFNDTNQVYLNNGSGSYTLEQTIPNQDAVDMSLGDLDGDGDVDAFVGNSQGEADDIYLNDGTGNFTLVAQIGNYSSEATALGDLDADGDLDIYIGDGFGGANRVWLNDGNGSFADSGQALGYSYTFGTAIADLDGDGDLDIFDANMMAETVWLNDGNGAFTFSGQYLGVQPPFPGIIQAGLKDNWLEGRNFSPNNRVIVSIYESEGGALVYGPISWTTDNNGHIWMNDSDHNLDILPGLYITMLDERTSILETLVVQNLAITNVDYDGGLVSGTAPLNTLVAVWLHDNGGYAETTSDPSDGTWTVDFGAPFSKSLWAGARVYDGDGDETFAEANQPRITVQPDHGWVRGLEWTKGNLVTMTIDEDLDSGNGFLYQATKVVGSAPWDPTQSYVDFYPEPAIDLIPAQYVTLSDETYIKIMQIKEVHFDFVDESNNLAFGRGPANTEKACVNIQTGTDGHQVCVSIDGNGDWIANFGADGFDIQNVTGANVQVFDDDGDTTMAHLLVPSIVSRLTQNQVEAWDWPEGTALTLAVDDPNTSENPDYFDDTVIVGLFNPPVNNSPYANFGIGDLYTLKPGDIVEVTGGGTALTMTVADLHITDVNVDNDTISGTAGDGIDQISIRMWSSPTEVVVDTSVVDNAWIADFSGIYDLGPEDNGVARWWDAKGNMTSDYFIIPNPNFTVSALSDWIELFDWPLNSTVTIEIDDPSDGTGDVDYFETVLMNTPSDWDPNITYNLIDTSSIFDIQPGFIVTVYDGATTKTHIISSVSIANIDIDTDMVTGIAEQYSHVDVHVCGNGSCQSRHVDADDSGTWIADFHLVGDEPDEQNIYDITAGVSVEVQQSDEDGDSTMYDIYVLWTPPPSVSLVFAISSPPDLSVPRATVENISVLNTLLDSLFRLNKDGNLLPLAATDYSVSPTDASVYTITLRSDAVWSDGEPVTAQHYVDGILRVLDPNVGSDYGFVLYPIKNAKAFNEGSITDPALVGVKALGPQLLEFTLEQPTSHFPQLLASPAMLPARQDVIDLYGDAWTSPDHFVSNGLYKLLESDDGHVVVEQNTLYNGPIPAVFSQLGFSIIPDHNQQIAEYKNGNIDVLLGVDLNNIINDLDMKKNMVAMPSPGVMYFGFMNQVTPTNDPLVRKALSSALDRQTVIDNILLTPWRVEAAGVIPPELDGYQGSIAGYSYNPLQAQDFLAQAGYPGGTGFPELNLIVNYSNRHIPALEEMATQWETVLGITVNIDYVTFEEYISIRAGCKSDPSTCQYNGYIGGWAVDYMDAYNIINDLFSPNSPNNFLQWDNLAYRDLIGLAVSELDPVQRISYLQQAEQILVEDDAAVLPLYFLDSLMVIRPGIYPYYSPSCFSNLAYWSDADPVGDGMTAEVVGTDGGTVTTEDNAAIVEIPTGALDSDVTLSVTDLGGNYQVTTSQAEQEVLTSYSIQPHGLQFNEPVTLTFAWNDVEDDGIIDGTVDRLETKIMLIKDGEPLTPACEFYAGCDTSANTISVEVLSLSLFELVVPSNEPPVVDSATFEVNEFASNGTAVGTATFTDPDDGQSHTCEIHEGNIDNAFAIDTDTCEITVNNSSALDPSTNPSFNLTVRVTDNGAPARHGDGSITVNVVPPPQCYNLTFASGPNGGDPTADPLKSRDCVSNGQYVAGEVISLTAHPDNGYQVDSWTNTDDDDSTASTNQLTMPDDNVTVSVTYTLLDYINPTVDGISLADASPTTAAVVGFIVTFSEAVTGVDGSDFNLTTSGVSGASVSSVTDNGDQMVYTVTVNTGSGNGTIGLDLNASNTDIEDLAGNPIIGGFTGGEVYEVVKSAPKPSIPVLLSPSNGKLLDTLQPALDWKDSIYNPQRYQIQVATNNTFTDLVVDETNLTTSDFTFTTALIPGKKYFWRVRAFNILDQTKGWSDVWNFKTPLSAPILELPVCDTSLFTDRPDFDWENVNGATKYTLQISRSTKFSLTTILFSKTVTVSELSMPKDLSQNKTLFWRVQAKTSMVNSPWSDVCSFTTGNPPSAPALRSPANGALVKTYLPTLKWYPSKLPSATTFKRYELQVDDDSDFSSPVIDASTTNGVITEVSYNLASELTPNVKFYWRVRAINLVGAEEHVSGWSKVWSFRTVILTSELLSPTDQSTVGTHTPTFDWGDVDGATSYELQVSTSPSFAAILIAPKVTASTYTPGTNLPKNKVLYWRMRPNGPNGPSSWSDIFQFTTPQ